MKEIGTVYVRGILPKKSLWQRFVSLFRSKTDEIFLDKNLFG